MDRRGWGNITGGRSAPHILFYGRNGDTAPVLNQLTTALYLFIRNEEAKLCMAKIEGVS